MMQGGLTEEEEARFQAYIERMKIAVRNSDIQDGIRLAKAALKIRDSEKLRRRIAKMEEHLALLEAEEEGEDVVDYGDDFFVSKILNDKLYPYQKEGLRWLWGLFLKKKGGILGDDMGLGKTIQIVTFLASLFEMQKIKTALIVMPLTLLNNWEAEFQKWVPGITVEQYHGSSKPQRERACQRIQRRGGVLLTTYTLLPSNTDVLGEYHGRPFIWDYLILDEGHKIKNATKTTKAANGLPSKNRIILTGTPIQNNLREMWSLFDFVHHGTLLGTMKTFKSEFENPIIRAREKDASVHEKRLGKEVSSLLSKRIGHYFLRRTKAEVLERSQGSDAPPSMRLVQKNDFVIWLQLSSDQIRLYEDFLSLDHVKQILMTKRSPLVELTVLKKICDHPRLLSANACAQLGLNGDENIECIDGDQKSGVSYTHMSIHTLIEESGKLKFLVQLLIQLKTEGHRCLVFSQSRIMLDIIERVLKNAKFSIMRIDGTVGVPSERQQRIKKFERDSSYSVFLLTTQVGGVGLTLTAANRVVIYDPSWNPATDSQAVDRVYRIGQQKAVIVYRLITCGTVEEKIYRRQVFKHSIHHQTVGNNANPTRYFSRQELKEMFTLEDPTSSKTQQQLEQMHAAQRKTNCDLDSHIAFLYSLGIVGISDHDLLFSTTSVEDEPIDDIGKKHIGDWIARANKLVEMECEMTDKARVEQGGFVKPMLPEDLDRQPKKIGHDLAPSQSYSKSSTSGRLPFSPIFDNSPGRKFDKTSSVMPNGRNSTELDSRKDDSAHDLTVEELVKGFEILSPSKEWHPIPDARNSSDRHDTKDIPSPTKEVLVSGNVGEIFRPVGSRLTPKQFLAVDIPEASNERSRSNSPVENEITDHNSKKLPAVWVDESNVIGESVEILNEDELKVCNSNEDDAMAELVEETVISETESEDSMKHALYRKQLNSTEIDPPTASEGEALHFNGNESIANISNVLCIEEDCTDKVLQPSSDLSAQILDGRLPKGVSNFPVPSRNSIQASRLRRSSMLHTLMNDLNCLQEEDRIARYQAEEDDKIGESIEKSEYEKVETYKSGSEESYLDVLNDNELQTDMDDSDIVVRKKRQLAVISDDSD